MDQGGCVQTMTAPVIVYSGGIEIHAALTGKEGLRLLLSRLAQTTALANGNAMTGRIEAHMKLDAFRFSATITLRNVSRHAGEHRVHRRGRGEEGGGE